MKKTNGKYPAEIIVHLEMLIEKHRAELVEQGPPAIFRAL
jgi:hypothetical protein